MSNDIESIDMVLLEINGITLFPIKGASGGIANAYIAYLIARHNNVEYSFPIEIVPKHSTSIENFNFAMDVLMENLNRLRKLFYLKIMDGTANIVNFVGGDLGRAHSNKGTVIEF